MRLAIMMATLVPLSALGTSIASAHESEIGSSVRVVHEEVFEPPTHSVLGDLLSTPQGCLDDRRVRIYFDYAGKPTEWVLVDVVRSGASGGWAGSGFMNDQFGFVSLIKAKLLPKDIGRRDHQHVCSRAADVYSTGTG
jgi:hypothetical protein